MLRAELFRQGINIDDCRRTNLWLHEPTPKRDKKLYEQELNWHFQQLMKEMYGRKAVLLMGAEPRRMFDVSYATCTPVRSSLVPAEVKVLCVSPNPAVALRTNAVIGTLRLAMQNFAEAIYDERI